MLSAPSIIDDFDYYIAYTGLHVVSTPTYTQDLQNCPITWTLVALDGGLETPLSVTQQQFVEVKTDGSINIDVGSDYTVLDENWDFRLKATSSDSSTNSMV